MDDNTTLQKTYPQISLIPLDNSEISEIIRPDENLERFASFLFPHPNTEGLKGKRELKFRIEKYGIDASISILPTVETPCYSCKTYDVLLALFAIWHEVGEPDGFYITASRVAKKMDLSLAGKILKSIEKDLELLNLTSLSWKRSYNVDGEERVSVDKQHILTRCDYTQSIDKENKVERFDSKYYVKFDERILANLRSKKTIPVNWTARKSITSPTAKVQYNILDNILTKYPKHKKSAKTIVEECGLPKERYKYKSQREELVTRLKKLLQGKRLSNLNKIVVKLVESADKTDWIIEYTSESDKKKKALPRPNRVNTDPNTIKELIHQIASVVGHEEKNYNLYKLFAESYSHDAIFRAIGEFKETCRADAPVRSKPKIFTTIMHITAHNLKYDWIKPCGVSCKFRPENNLPF